MPLPIPLIAAGIPAVAEIAGNILNNGAVNNQNRRNRKFSEYMYDKQRSDSIADWKMQNEYNSPAAQMARYEAAGLNKNLIYGQANSAAPVRSTDFKQPEQGTPHYETRNTGNSIAAYLDARLKTAQTDNVAALTKVAIETAALTAANTTRAQHEVKKTDAETSSISQNMQQSKSMFPVSLEKSLSEVDKIKADTRYTLDQNERSALVNNQTLKKGIIEIMHMRLQNAKTAAETEHIKAQIKNLEQDTRIKSFEEKLHDAGVTSHDNIWIRLGAKVVQSLQKGLSVEDAVKMAEFLPIIH
nr:MAG: DNA pilot protein [Microvirus sp.]